jgi:hypothetical protein
VDYTSPDKHERDRGEAQMSQLGALAGRGERSR